MCLSSSPCFAGTASLIMNDINGLSGFLPSSSFVLSLLSFLAKPLTWFDFKPYLPAEQEEEREEGTEIQCRIRQLSQAKNHLCPFSRPS